jgi:hypothetical protein
VNEVRRTKAKLAEGGVYLWPMADNATEYALMLIDATLRRYPSLTILDVKDEAAEVARELFRN